MNNLFVPLFGFFMIIILSILLILQFNKIKNLKLKYKNLQDLYDETRAFKHDFNNIIFTIGGYIYNKDLDNLQKYYNSLLNDCTNSNSLSILDSKILNDPGVYNLVSTKYKKAKDLNIIMNLEIFFNFKNLKISTYHFCRILGILLDNAIEAASESKEKKLTLSIRDSANLHTQIIMVENSCSSADSNIDINSIYKKGYSKKAKHSGLGLWEVNQILNKEKNLKINTSIDNNIFKQTLEIFY